MPAQPAPLPQFALRCLSPRRARAFAEHLTSRQVVVEGIEADSVLLRYGGTLEFVIDVACAAVLGEYAAAQEMVGLLALTDATRTQAV